MTPAKETRALHNIVARGDPLEEWQRDTIGPTGQLRIPLRDKIDLRRVATILRELANRLEVMSSLRHVEDFGALLQAKGEIRSAQARLQSRPKNS